MTIKDFQAQEVPSFNFEIQKEKSVIIQCFLIKSELAKKLIGIEKQATEIKNAFKVLKTSNDSSFKVGDIVSIPDSMVDRPIVSWKHPEGNDPNKEGRPVYGSYLQGLLPFSFYCSKLDNEIESPELTFLIPEDLITIKHII